MVGEMEGESGPPPGDPGERIVVLHDAEASRALRRSLLRFGGRLRERGCGAERDAERRYAGTALVGRQVPGRVQDVHLEELPSTLAQCRRDPLRHAAARRRLAAGARRGGRRRPVRRSSSAAPGRGGRRSSPRWSPASSRARSACRCRSSSSSTLDPELGRAEPDPEIQDLLPRARARISASTSCPGALTFRPAAGPRSPSRSSRPNRLVRRARHERRPHGAEPEPAAVARPSLADRPRCGALFPPRRRRPAEDAERRASRRSRDHVLLPYAGSIADADERLARG